MASPRTTGALPPRAFRPSLLLASASMRVAGASALAAALWTLTGWALGWWA